MEPGLRNFLIGVFVVISVIMLFVYKYAAGANWVLSIVLAIVTGGVVTAMGGSFLNALMKANPE